LENVPLWHERDISHSSVERVILPDSCICIDFILYEISRVLENLIVYPDNMLRNLERTKGLIFSQVVLLALIEKGLSREEAYKIVQRNGMEAWNSDASFKDLLISDKNLHQYLTSDEIEQLFDLKEVLERIDGIFKRAKKRNRNGKG
ncbi:MAG: adenylosuccinate lyase, partial [Candidatus Marinimicrobia bacterium]|nr:adenylosuccinate lyase [Candidatus Neomarinimicrobiota bacterium]